MRLGPNGTLVSNGKSAPYGQNSWNEMLLHHVVSKLVDENLLDTQAVQQYTLKLSWNGIHRFMNLKSLYVQCAQEELNISECTHLERLSIQADISVLYGGKSLTSINVQQGEIKKWIYEEKEENQLLIEDSIALITETRNLKIPFKSFI